MKVLWVKWREGEKLETEYRQIFDKVDTKISKYETVAGEEINYYPISLLLQRKGWFRKAEEM